MTRTLQIRGLVLSVIALGVIGALVGGATVAFYGDVERSTGNTFTAGGVELRVDSVSHYNNMVCTEVDEDVYQWQPEEGFDPAPDHYPQAGTECDGTWAETDLEAGVHKFFNFLDLKPGDEGEDTISLHVYDNPAWGQFLIENVLDADVTCTDPEQEAEDGACVEPDGDGEIDDYLAFTAWVDHGAVPGFQCGEEGPDNAMCEADPTEGDNTYQDTEVVFWDNELVSNLGPFDLAPLFATAYDAFDCDEEGAIDGDTAYGECHGFAEDGRMVPSVTYYFGLAWELPLLETKNDAQTDTYQADMVFRVEQHRNNPDPFQSDEPERELTTLTGDTWASVVGSFTEAWQADGRWGDGGTTPAENEVRIGLPGGGSPIVQAHGDNSTGPWRDGVPENFTFTFDGTESALTIGDVTIDSADNPAMIPGANGVLGITLKTTDLDEMVELTNLELDGIAPPVTSASASDGDRASIVIGGDTELADGFTLTGTVEFSWDSVPAGAESMGILFQVEND